MALQLRSTMRYRERLTRAGEALARQLEGLQQPVISHYNFFLLVREIYESGEKLYLRRDRPTRDDAHRLKRNLLDANYLAYDPNYKNRAYRILSNGGGAAEDICCLVDPFCYVSHISAMQRYGLTDRRPQALHISVPSQRIRAQLIKDKMESDYGTYLNKADHEEIEPLTGTVHPKTVRRRKLKAITTAHFGKHLRLRGSFARIATIGQTFVDMLDHPTWCGGMGHILDVWHKHAEIYLEDIIAAVQRAPNQIVKVRAGYILNEHLGLMDSRIIEWERFAQRGGSRVLDPSKEYVPVFSDRWMISINV